MTEKKVQLLALADWQESVLRAAVAPRLIYCCAELAREAIAAGRFQEENWPRLLTWLEVTAYGAGRSRLRSVGRRENVFQ